MPRRPRGAARPRLPALRHPRGCRPRRRRLRDPVPGQEFHPRRFRLLLQRAAAQASAANPPITVLAGISTHPPTGAARWRTMVRAAEIAAPRVDGLWVNVFSGHARQRHVGGMLFYWLQVHRY